MGRISPLEPLFARLGLHHPTFAVCISQLGASILQTTFMFYYVKVHLNHFHISDGWFQVAQVLFMVWNSINDPLFGYYQDVLGAKWVRNRTKVMLYGAPFYALSFLLPWFGWSGPDSPSWVAGVHLITALFFYDALYSFVMLAWSALFAELTMEPSGRVKAMVYMQVMVLISVNVITVVEKYSLSLQDYAAFQRLTLVLAVIGFVCIAYTGLYAPDTSAQSKAFKHVVDGPSETNTATWTHAWMLTKQVVSSRDFICLTAMNLLHQSRSTAHLNFMAIFTEGLIPRSILPLGSWNISAFYGICALLPQILVIASGQMVNSFGSHRLMMCSFVVSMLMSLVAMFMGYANPYLVMGLMVVDSVLVHSFSPLINIMFVDVIDDDMIRHRRQSPISSMIFSINALFTKPAQSLAPMLVVGVLGEGYSNYTQDKTHQTDSQYEPIRYNMFILLCLFPLILGGLQYLVFHFYSLTDRHTSPAHRIESRPDMERLL